MRNSFHAGDLRIYTETVIEGPVLPRSYLCENGWLYLVHALIFTPKLPKRVSLLLVEILYSTVCHKFAMNSTKILLN